MVLVTGSKVFITLTMGTRMGLVQVEDFPGTWWGVGLTCIKISFSLL